MTAWLAATCLASSMATGAVFDDSRSQAEFRVHTRLPFRSEGRFENVGGRLEGNREAGWRVEVDIDGRGLRFEGPAWMERLTRGEDFLAVERYPAIRFRSEPFADEILRAGGELYGRLTLRGRERPVSVRLLASSCARPGYDCELTVGGALSRHEFGMNAYRHLVKDAVEFDFTIRLASDGAP